MVSQKIEILSQDQNLHSEYYSALNKNDFKGAREILQKRVELAKTHPKLFEGPEDHIRKLKFQIAMISYREKREISGGEKAVKFLRKAAKYSTPTVCLGKRCPLDPTCCVQRAKLSDRQKKMCIEKINAICTALKLEAAIAVRTKFDHKQALKKRKQAVSIHSNIIKSDPKRVPNQDYLEYWYFVTEGYTSLFNGCFEESKKWFIEKAIDKAKRLPFKKCFRNYFRNIAEIQAHEIYIDAVKKVKLARFGEASKLFQTWLNLFYDEIERKGKRDPRYDNIKIFAMICDILERLPEGDVKEEDWDDLDDFADLAYTAKPTWALLTELRYLRQFYFKSPPRTRLIHEINAIAQKWKLFIPDIELLAKDKEVGPKRRILPSFIDIFNYLSKSDHDWQKILLQNLKHALLLLADYEYLRCLTPPLGEENLTKMRQKPLKPSERMSISQLVEVILIYLKRRDRDKARTFENAFNKYFPQLISANDSDNFDGAKRVEESLLKRISFPHVIQVKEIGISHEFYDEKSPYLLKKIICRRLWNQKPDIITFEGLIDLEKDSFYYLGGRWNMRKFEKKRIRHELILQSEIPELINIFLENLMGIGDAKPKRFHDWILQFDDRERLLACKLLGMIKYYTEDEVRERWLRLYRKKLPPEAKIEKVAYVGLGHTAKSGPYHCHYPFHQAMSKLNQNEYSFEFKKAFREISEYDREKEKPHTVVFVDDFIGMGTQAIDWFISREEAYFRRYPWLNEANVYYCALVGFKKGITAIKKTLCPKKIKDVLVLEELNEKDRTFSPENPNWKSKKERLRAERWTSEIGRQVLTGMPKYDNPQKGIYPEDHRLGWNNSQAPIVFHYNVPNNTLPILWGEGERNGKKWKPLWIRYD